MPETFAFLTRTKRRRSLMREMTTTALVIATADLAGCGSESPADKIHARTTSLAGEIVPPDPIRGSSLFAANCSRCHGEKGMGSRLGPPLIHRIYAPTRPSDLAFYRAILGGSRQHHWSFGNMQPIAGVKVWDIAHIIAYVRQQQRRVGIE